MSEMGSIFNRLTGAASRHNHALDEVREWTARVEKFLDAYGLPDNAGPGRLLANSGDAKFDLTGIAYSGRGLVVKARDIKDKRVAPLVEGMLRDIEGMRRYLMNPALQADRLDQAIDELCAGSQALRASLGETEYL